MEPAPMPAATPAPMPAAAQETPPAATPATQEPMPMAPATPPALDWSKLGSEFKARNLGPFITGGRIVDVAVDPRSDSTIYAASASGGLFKTVNNGTTWTCIFEKEGTISIGDIAIDPSNPETIWIGTGESNNQRSSYWGDGIYKSTDGGKTWTNVGLKDSHHIGRIVVDPTNSNVVYVAALGHLYSYNEERGLFRTTDGGTTWQKVLYVNERVGVVDVTIDPQHPNVLYAASYERLRRPWNFDGEGPGSAIYKSTDQGTTWTKLGGGLPSGEIGRIGIEVYPKNPNIVYAVVPNHNKIFDAKSLAAVKKEEDGNFTTPIGAKVKIENNEVKIVSVDRDSIAARAQLGQGRTLYEINGRAVTNETDLANAFSALRPGDTFPMLVGNAEKKDTITIALDNSMEREIGGEVYRSEDAGNTWTKQNTAPAGGDPDYYYGQLRIDPQNDQQIYLAGVPLFSSSDAGKTWKTDTAGSVHVDHHSLWINPKNSNHLILGNDGGFHMSYDKGATWDHFYNLPITQFYAITVDTQAPYHVYGGTQDNGSWGGPSSSFDGRGIGESEWYRVGGGDGFYVSVDPTDSDEVIAESQFGALFKLNKKTGFRRGIQPPQSDPNDNPDRYNWNSPVLRSQHDPRTIYFGGNKLFKSFNTGDDWLTISPDLSGHDLSKISGNVPYGTITTIAESPSDKNRLLVGTDDGKLQWTNDGGKNWTEMSSRLPFRPAGWWCTRVVLSKHDPNTAYATFSGYREDDFRPYLFVTTDAGATWQSIAGDMPNAPVNVLVEDPENKSVLYVGTDLGLFASVNRGKNWFTMVNDLPRVAVHDLAIQTRDKALVVGTHGRAFYIVDDISPISSASEDALKKTAHLFPVRNLPRAQGTTLAEKISGNRNLVSPNLVPGRIISYHLLQTVSASEISLEVVDAEGKTITKLEPKTEAGLHRISWNPEGGGFGGRRRGGGGGPRRPGGPGAPPRGPINTADAQVILKVKGEEFKVPLE